MNLSSPERAKDRRAAANILVRLVRPSHFSWLFLLLVLGASLVRFAGSASRAYAATAATSPAASAASISGKDAQLNGAPMPVGATLFPGDIIRLGEASTAALRFEDSVVLAAPLTELVVEAEGVSLHNGRLQVRAGGAKPFAVTGPFFHVGVGASSAGAPSSAEIRLTGRRAQVSAVAGAADLTAEGTVAPFRLNAGETATVDATGEPASPQSAANPEAGQVSRLTPQVQIDRGSQHLVVAISDRVYWNDDLRSGPTGRAHVTLKDGSQLNLGSDSSLRVVQHDAAQQQTSLDLLVGRMRGRITKLNKPGAKFEVHTPVGIAGLVGTDFSLFVNDDGADLMVFEGTVKFTTLGGQAITVNAGNFLHIAKSGMVEGPRPSTTQEVQTAQSQTDVTVAPATAGGPAGPVVAGTRSIVPLVITISGTAAAIGIGVYEGTRSPVSNSVP
jgi:ferric-dicitrate binding protein FerR (iron transport regulator)